MILVVLLALVIAAIFYVIRIFAAFEDSDPIDAILYIVAFIINGCALIYVITLFIDFFKIN